MNNVPNQHTEGSNHACNTYRLFPFRLGPSSRMCDSDKQIKCSRGRPSMTRLRKRQRPYDNRHMLDSAGRPIHKHFLYVVCFSMQPNSFKLYGKTYHVRTMFVYRSTCRNVLNIQKLHLQSACYLMYYPALRDEGWVGPVTID